MVPEGTGQVGSEQNTLVKLADGSFLCSRIASLVGNVREQGTKSA